MVIARKISLKNGAWKKLSSRALPFFFCFVLCFEAGCASDSNQLKLSRSDYQRDEFVKAESELYTPEVFKQAKNRLLHYYFLSSIAMSEGQFEKAVYFLNKARDQANSVRSSNGTFEWFSSNYLSNPIEYSYIHSMLVMAYSLLAEAGNTPAWNTPEIRDEKGNILVPAQTFAARTYDNRDIAGFRSKARSELLAWDSFLQMMRNTYPTGNYYKEDLWARMLASYVLGHSSDTNDRNSAVILTQDMQKIFQKEFTRYPSASQNQAQIEAIMKKLKTQASGKAPLQSLLVCEAGVMSTYKTQRYVLGLSTLFGQIQDPGLRRAFEEVGMRSLLTFAPEFGLIALGGGIAGAISGGTDNDNDEIEGPPKYFTDAIDRSFGFEVRFPALRFPPSDTEVSMSFSKPGAPAQTVKMAVVSPLQEMIATELKAREGKEMLGKAVTIGIEYIAILVPAIKAYKAAEGNVLKKIGILAAYYMAKKAIDAANSPDLRSWNFLPKVIAADVVDLPPGDYDAKLMISNHFGRDERAVGKVTLGDPNKAIQLKRVGDVPILNRLDSASHAPVH